MFGFPQEAMKDKRQLTIKLAKNGPYPPLERDSEVAYVSNFSIVNY